MVTSRMPSPLPEPIRARLQARLGRALLTQRLHLESHYVARVFGHGLTYFHIENMLWLHWFIRLGFKMLGLYGRGRRNALDVKVRHNRLPLRRLPPEFEGYTLLQVSDLHLDVTPGLVDAVAAVIKPLKYDVAVLTGDFRARTYGEIGTALNELARLRPEFRGEVYGVMGNHDFVEMLPPMEDMGIRFLMNEHVWLRRGEATVCLAGVDDSHFYETDNIQAAAAHLEKEVPAILLSHSPEIYRKAAACGFDAVLCGHTHGGQICLPGGIPFVMNARAPIRTARGAWTYRGMVGYTSAGAGCSGVEMRFWCPPEVTLHTLTRAP